MLFSITSVTAQSTQPVANATVKVTDGNGVLYGTTDANGDVTLLVKAKQHDITVSAYGHKTKTVNNVNFATTHDVEISLESAPFIVGQITSNASPVYGVRVEAEGGYTTITDKEGRYAVPADGSVGSTVSIDANPLGTEDLLMKGDKVMDVMREFVSITGAAVNFPEGFNIVIPKGLSTNVVQKSNERVVLNDNLVHHDIQLDTSYSISGYVRSNGQPVENAIVLASTHNSSVSYAAMGITDADGHFVINYNIVNVQYDVSVFAKGYTIVSQTISVNSDTEVDFNLTSSVTVAGKVFSNDNIALSNVTVLFTVGNIPIMTQTDANGEYEILSGLAPGEYNVTFGYLIGAMPVISNATVTLSEGANNVDLTLPVTMMSFTGNIDDPDRDHLLEPVTLKIIAHVSMGFYSLDIPFTQFIGQEGSFSFSVPKSIDIQGMIVNVSSFTVKVGSDYYYDEFTVEDNISPDSEYNLGTINVDTGALTNVTIHVDGVSSDVTLPTFNYPMLIKYGDNEFTLSVSSNSSLEMAYYMLQSGEGNITFHVGGPTGTNGFIEFTIPKALMSSPYTISIDGKTAGYTVVNENATHVTLRITYNHSEHDVSVQSSNAIPEFPLTPAAVLIVLAVIVIVLMKKRIL